ncbi:TolC family protein [Clostridium rectalis]|uniref:TolC family protein n=1 Tax=Clostridium rectalis TaxID=2040295 RepID=UPI000F63E746|nr:TolC family protein [Clostridium rectalis]
MKKIKIFSVLLVFFICIYPKGLVFANGNSLDLEKIIKNAVESSYSVKAVESELIKARNNYKDELSLSNNLEKRLRDNDRFISLKNKSQRTKEEEEEYLSYVMIYGEPMDDSEIVEANKSVITIPVKNEYYIYQCKNKLQVTKNNALQKIYEKYSYILKDRDNLQIYKEKFNSAENDFNKIKIQSDLGIISKLEEKEKESNFLREKENYENAKRKFNLLVMEFNKVIGAPIDTEYTNYLKDYYMGYIVVKPYEDYILDALKNRAEVLNGKEYVDTLRYANSVAVNLYPKYHRERDIAEFTLENAEDLLELKKLDIKMEVKKLYDDLKVKCKSLESYRESYNEAKSQLDELSLKYTIGNVSRNDFENKKIEYEEKILKYKNLQRDIWLAQLKLDNACSLGTDAEKTIY